MTDTPIGEAMTGHSLDVAAENLKKLKDLFPGVFTETKSASGEVVESVDFERLKAEIGTFSDVFEGRRERYGMDWPGKKDALKLIQSPSYATLKPVENKSVAFDTTENLFIEGDNLEVLKLLQKSYYGRVKMIYIDPPYNTGKDFIYPDNFSENIETYLSYTGLLNEDGKKLATNTASEGRFHTKWLNMLYPRLYLAKNLLSKDGVIFVSISDEELGNLRLLMDDVFGESNLLACLIWNKQHSQQQGVFKKYHEYVLLYANNIDEIDNISGGEGIIEAGALKKISKANPASNFSFPAGVRFDATDGLTLTGTFGDSEQVTVVEGKLCAKDGKTTDPVVLSAGWTQKDQMTKFFAGEEVIDSKGQNVVEFYFNSAGKIKCKKERSKITPPTLLPEYGMVSEQTAYIESLFGKAVFDNPKPVQMIRDFTSWFVREGDVVVDFFAGSGTTGEAIFRETGTTAQFIAIQLPEKIDDSEESGKNAISLGYKTIADISSARLLKIADKLNSENSVNDYGFRYLRLDKSNFKRWQKLGADATVEQISTQLDLHIEHIESSATPEDLLFEILLKAGFRPTEKYSTVEIAGIPVFSVAEGSLLVCLAPAVTRELIDAVSEAEPMQFVCLDSAFGGNDQLKANAAQTFAARNQGRDKARQIIFRTV